MSSSAGQPAGPPHAPGPAHSPRRFWAWFGIDVLCLLAFAVVGSFSHEGGLLDLPRVAWPFLLALLVVWVLPMTRMTSLLVWPTGVMVWAVTSVGGLALRWVTGGGVSGAMPVITIVVLGVLLIGWRLIAHFVERGRVATAHRDTDAGTR